MIEDLLKTYAYKTGEFTLASGQTSDEYLDVKEAMHHPYAARRLVQCVLDEFVGTEIALAGVADGSIAIAAVAVYVRNLYSPQSCHLLTILKERKQHGTKQQIVGLDNLKDFKNDYRFVGIIEDVWTTGESTAKAIRAAQAEGLNVRQCVAVVDREAGAVARLTKEFPKIVFSGVTTLKAVRDGKRWHEG